MDVAEVGRRNPGRGSDFGAHPRLQAPAKGKIGDLPRGAVAGGLDSVSQQRVNWPRGRLLQKHDQKDSSSSSSDKAPSVASAVAFAKTPWFHERSSASASRQDERGQSSPSLWTDSSGVHRSVLIPFRSLDGMMKLPFPRLGT